jgi:hypothetical protein
MRTLLLVLLAGTLTANTAAAQAPEGSTQPREGQPGERQPEEGQPESAVPRFDLAGRLLEGFRTAGLIGRWYLLPSLSLSEEFDSNVFGSASDRESDFITRPVAGLAVGYVTDRVNLVVGATFDAEIFAKNSNENDTGLNSLGSVDVQYPLSPRLTTSLGGAYSRTESVVDIRRETGVTAVEVGRQDISVARASLMGSYLLDAVTTGDARYSFTYTDVSGGPRDTEHGITLGVTRGFTPLDSGLLRYSFEYFDSDEVGTATSHTARIGYARLFTPRTRLSIEVGPQFSEGDVTASVDIALTHQFRRASLVLSYTRGQDIVVGLAGARTEDTLSAGLTFEPIRSLSAGLSGSVSRVSGLDDPESTDTTVYSFLATISYPLARGLAGRATYRFLYDDNGGSIARHVVTLTLDFTYPILLR